MLGLWRPPGQVTDDCGPGGTSVTPLHHQPASSAHLPTYSTSLIHTALCPVGPLSVQLYCPCVDTGGLQIKIVAQDTQ